MIIGIWEDRVIDTDDKLAQHDLKIGMFSHRDDADLYYVHGMLDKRSLKALIDLDAFRFVWPQGYESLLAWMRGDDYRLSGYVLWWRLIRNITGIVGIVALVLTTFVAVIIAGTRNAEDFFLLMLPFLFLPFGFWAAIMLVGNSHIQLTGLRLRRLYGKYDCLRLGPVVGSIINLVASRLKVLNTPVLKEDVSNPDRGRLRLACGVTMKELDALVRKNRGIFKLMLEAQVKHFTLLSSQEEEMNKRLRHDIHQIARRIDERRRQELEAECRRKEEERSREWGHLRQRRLDGEAFRTRVQAFLSRSPEEAEKS